MEIQLLDMKTGMECFAWQWELAYGTEGTARKDDACA